MRAGTPLKRRRVPAGPGTDFGGRLAPAVLSNWRGNWHNKPVPGTPSATPGTIKNKRNPAQRG